MEVDANRKWPWQGARDPPAPWVYIEEDAGSDNDLPHPPHSSRHSSLSCIVLKHAFSRSSSRKKPQPEARDAVWPHGSALRVSGPCNCSTELEAWRYRTSNRRCPHKTETTAARFGWHDTLACGGCSTTIPIS